MTPDWLERITGKVRLLTDSIREMGKQADVLAEVTAVALAKVAYVDDIGVEVSSRGELYAWALRTDRNDLADLLEVAPPHITKLFPEGRTHD